MNTKTLAALLCFSLWQPAHAEPFFEFKKSESGSTVAYRHGKPLPFYPDQHGDYQEISEAEEVDLDSDGVPEVHLILERLGGRNGALSAFFKYDAKNQRLQEIPSANSLHDVYISEPGYVHSHHVHQAALHHEVVKYNPTTGVLDSVYLDNVSYSDIGHLRTTSNGTYMVDKQPNIFWREPLQARITGKATLYSAPNKATAMYLVEGDEVTLLEQRVDAADQRWQRVLYQRKNQQGKKELKLWIKYEQMQLKATRIFRSKRFDVQHKYFNSLRVVDRRSGKMTRAVHCNNTGYGLGSHHAELRFLHPNKNDVDASGRYLRLRFEVANFPGLNYFENIRRRDITPELLPRCALLDMQTAGLLRIAPMTDAMCKQDNFLAHSGFTLFPYQANTALAQLNAVVSHDAQFKTSVSSDAMQREISTLVCNSRGVEGREAAFKRLANKLKKLDYAESAAMLPLEIRRVRLRPGVYTHKECKTLVYIGKDHYAFYHDSETTRGELNYMDESVIFESFKGVYYDGERGGEEFSDGMWASIENPEAFAIQTYGNGMNPFSYPTGCADKFQTFTRQNDLFMLKGKTVLYSDALKPTKMYLVRGDFVQLLAKKTRNWQQWASVRYFGNAKGNKNITKWVKAEALYGDNQ